MEIKIYRLGRQSIIVDFGDGQYLVESYGICGTTALQYTLSRWRKNAYDRDGRLVIRDYKCGHMGEEWGSGVTHDNQVVYNPLTPDNIDEWLNALPLWGGLVGGKETAIDEFEQDSVTLDEYQNDIKDFSMKNWIERAIGESKFLDFKENF